MKKISVYRKDGSLGWQATMESQSAAIWRDQQIANNSWGKPDRWVPSENEICRGENMADATHSRTISDEVRGDRIEYFFPKEYSIVEEDLADQPYWESLRAERNLRLAECDWCVLSDADLTTTQKTAWKAYRQLLRDLPENTVDPRNPQWPSKPS